MIIFISVVGFILAIVVWLFLTPLTICLNTSVPSRMLFVELRGAMRCILYLQDGDIFVRWRILFLGNEIKLPGKKKRLDRKKKLIEEKGKKSPGSNSSDYSKS